MKLKKLEITGFKSFMGKTRIVFPPGTTGVVGPNGCGKSNVVDALRWVMGEQNVRKLRGKTSEDIIFAGSAGNAPMNMAEVSLTIDNEDGSVVGPFNEYSEITVTRRIFRTGESNYLINRQPARLKDIQTLFLGTGTGKNAFAVIQQGNIGALTDASPEERRVFIEEAADVTKYKARKRDTESKIKSTRENLERVGDILAELTNQLASLKRQAKKALLFKELQQSIRDLDLTLAGVEYLQLGQRAKELVSSTERTKERTKAAVTKRDALANAMSRLKLHAQETTDTIEATNRKIYELKRLADRDETEIGHQKDKAAALKTEVEEDTRLLAESGRKTRELTEEIRSLRLAHGDLDQVVTGLDKEMEEAEHRKSTARSRLSDLEQESHKASSRHMALVAREASVRHAFTSAQKLHENADRKLKRRDEDMASARAALATATEKGRTLEAEMAEFKGQTAELREHMDDLRDGINLLKKEADQANETIKAKEIEESRVRSYLDTMEAMVKNFDGYGDGVKEGMDRLEALGSSSQGVVANLLQVEKGYEAAAEAALGSLLTYILVDSRDTALHGAHAMEENGGSRCGFLPPGHDAMSAYDGPALPGCRPLTELMVADGPLSAPLPALLSRLFVADDLAAAASARAACDHWVAVATTDGSLVDFTGAVIAGTPGTSASLLKRRSDMAEAREKLSAVGEELNTARNLRSGLQTQLDAQKEALKQAESEMGGLLRMRSEKERECLLADEQIKQGKKHLTLMDLETEQLSGDLGELEEEMDEARQKLDAVQGELAALTKGEEAAKEDLAKAREHLAQAELAIVELKLSLAREEAKHENHRATLKRLTDFLKEGEERSLRLTQGIEKKTRESAAALERAAKLEAGLEKAFKNVTAEEEALAVTRHRLARIEADMAEKENETRELAGLHDELAEALRKEEVELAGVLTRGDELKTRVAEQYRAPIDQLIPAFEEAIQDVLDGTSDKKDLADKLAGLKRKIARLGDVNPAAVAQYDEVNERHGFLTEQQTDLNASLDDLEAIIRKINRITQERFIDTFHRINEKLDEIFPRLFEGGSARLVLTEPTKPMETGVELMIQPPGKKQARLSLLSGGEKALSAIAFVFSIFLLKPSSFCVMDEIDAPLDDANVQRFNNLVTMIAEKSQILVITHNKITMEHADILIGVTMEKKGVSKVVSVNLCGKELPTEFEELDTASV
ncbi:chromosome segregation protein SMC [Desulfoluna butyratoxydans]|uniref:Chromosome partition protein Smc n=1 Tax=Desulfoluna butyratoxydans TaxID=231438 RepID=A0A4U8YPD4_9BACT|nr:chromosome segregation protein SMC [Desulfoluna butyratoxydans]VFQ46085.1 structural maintenance of chromosomes protein prokaryotic [Desulfoluna butyratoxydans]